MSDTKPTRNQERAQVAYRRIQVIHDQNEDLQKEYRRRCVELPALIRKNGLCQALAFYEVKGKAGDESKQESKSDKSFAFRQVLNDLAEITKIADNGAALASKVRDEDVVRYQWMTREALVRAEWMKRYAEAILPESEE